MTQPRSPGGSPALVLSKISKQFGAVSALEDVSFSVRAGTVHALLGENGAGKTTLMRIAFGLLAPDTGTVTVAGAIEPIASAADAIDAGLGMVHQHFTNVPAMTVAENVALGGRGWLSMADASRRIAHIGAQSGLTLDPSARAGELPVSGQQRLEIVKALARDTRTLILDEPTAVLAPAEADELLRWLRRFANEGNAVVLITHKLHEALRIADDVTVLRRGRVVLNSSANAMTADSLASAMLGQDLAKQDSASVNRHVGRVVVTAAGIEVLDERRLVAIRDAHFSIRAGEIVGVAAVEGAGQRTLLRALGGRTIVTKGSLALPTSIGFVPEDRHRDALLLSFSLTENLALKGAGDRHGWISLREFGNEATTLVEEFDVRGGSSTIAARSLSGGNQQKFVLARELRGTPELLVVENPTRGLDIRATAAVRDRLRTAAANGAAVVMYSSDLEEVLALSTRVLVVHAGFVREYAPDRDVVGAAMLGLC